MATQAATKRGRPRRLTVERILLAAIQVVESGGAKALTMEGVARRLGVGTMTLYGYVDSREDLIDRTVAFLLDRAPSAPAVLRGDWTEDVVAHCMALRRWLIDRPALLLLDAERPHLSDAVATFYAGELTGLMRGGFDVDGAVVLRQAIAAQLFGQIRWEEIRRSSERSGVRADNRERARGGTVPPLVAEAHERLACLDPEALYERSLRALLDGFLAARSGAGR
jgi:AcrR family transcriptional regulator